MIIHTPTVNTMVGFLLQKREKKEEMIEYDCNLYFINNRCCSINYLD